jgi:hypothetical protein
MTRLFIAALGLLLSSAAFACPQISGTFHCNSDQPEDIVVQTRVENGVTIYNYNGQDIIADGVQRDYSSQGTTVKLAATCNDTTFTMQSQMSSINIAEVGAFLCNGPASDQADIKTDYSVDGTNIKEVGTAAIHCADGHDVPLNNEYTCTKVK